MKREDDNKRCRLRRYYPDRSMTKVLLNKGPLVNNVSMTVCIILAFLLQAPLVLNDGNILRGGP